MCESHLTSQSVQRFFPSWHTKKLLIVCEAMPHSLPLPANLALPCVHNTALPSDYHTSSSTHVGTYNLSFCVARPLMASHTAILLPPRISSKGQHRTKTAFYFIIQVQHILLKLGNVIEKAYSWQFYSKLEAERINIEVFENCFIPYAKAPKIPINISQPQLADSFPNQHKLSYSSERLPGKIYTWKRTDLQLGFLA